MAYLKNSYEHWMQREKRMRNETNEKAKFDVAEKKFLLAMDPNSGLSRDERDRYLNERNRLLDSRGGFMANWRHSGTRPR